MEARSTDRMFFAADGFQYVDIANKQLHLTPQVNCPVDLAEFGGRIRILGGISWNWGLHPTGENLYHILDGDPDELFLQNGGLLPGPKTWVCFSARSFGSASEP